MTYKCPVCFYPGMKEPATDFSICSCCGTEFENDDLYATHAELRAQWISVGKPWFFGSQPAGWSPSAQLASASFSTSTVKQGLVENYVRAFTAVWGSSHFGEVKLSEIKVSSTDVKITLPGKGQTSIVDEKQQKSTLTRIALAA